MTSSLRTSHIDRCSSTAEATSGNPVAFLVFHVDLICYGANRGLQFRSLPPRKSNVKSVRLQQYVNGFLGMYFVQLRIACETVSSSFLIEVLLAQK
jgi:hypothetical protein